MRRHAAVVDNQSQDPTFTIGRGKTPSLIEAAGTGRAAAAASTTLPRTFTGFVLLSGLAVLVLASANFARRGRMRGRRDAAPVERWRLPDRLIFSARK